MVQMEISGAASARHRGSGSAALTLDFGVVRCFGSADIGRQGLGHGWSAPEDAHCWNDGPEVKLTLAAARPDFRCVLVVEGTPLVGAARAAQDMTLYVNGWRLGFWRLTDASSVQLETMIDPGHWQIHGLEGLLDIAFHLPGSLRLSTVEPHGDDRELGFCFRTLALLPVPHDN
jgi:hypothetical protein